MADIVIYGSPVSPFVRKVEAVLAEKNIAFESDSVDVFNPPEWFLEISPLKRIPVMRDRSVGTDGAAGTIADSSAICSYLDRKQPDPALYGDDAFAHGHALWVEEFADSTLAATGGLGIFRAVFFNALRGEAPDIETARKTWADQMPPLLDYLESDLASREFFAGNQFSIADISVAVQLMQTGLVAEFDLATKWPGLAAHLDRTSARKSMQGGIAKAEKFVRRAVPERINLD
ncbi:glutathione S-transferase family protein [Altererythrobacter sp.]|nr:glutathione S-transferase family protein [Altererythrobacter sp.]